MAWYSAGTINVANGSNAVTGSGGAAFLDNGIRNGSALIGPDGRTYEIVSIPSNSQMVIAPAYLGATDSGEAYAIMPTSSLAADLIAAITALATSYEAVRDGIGAGLFPDGTAASPGFRFANDQDSGFYRIGSNTIGIALGGARSLTFTPGLIRMGADSGFMDVGYSGGAGYLAASAGGIGQSIAGAQAYTWSIGGVARLAFSEGALYPLANNVIALGQPGYGFTTLYASSGAINTSDERLKTWRGPLSDAELAAAREIARAAGIYQWNDAIAEKGPEGARWHAGVKAQQVVAIMTAHGLHPMRYGFVCYDSWGAEAAVPDVPATDDHPMIPGRPGRAAGDRYGVRPDELCMFLIAAQEQRLTALEAA